MVPQKVAKTSMVVNTICYILANVIFLVIGVESYLHGPRRDVYYALGWMAITGILWLRLWLRYKTPQ